MTVVTEKPVLMHIDTNPTPFIVDLPTQVTSPKYPSVAVVIPTLNEARNLEHVLPKIPAWVNEIILVDGFSTDDTVAVAQALCPRVQVVYEKVKGKGAALRAGFAVATSDLIVMIDADGSTAPEEIPAFVEALNEGADFAKGSRYMAGGGSADITVIRSLGNLVFTYLVRWAFGGEFTDLCYGYNAFRRDALPYLDLDGDGFEIETMMNIRAHTLGLKVVEIPSFEQERIHGQSNLRTIPDGWRVIKTIVSEFIRERKRNANSASLTYRRQEQQDWA